MILSTTMFGILMISNSGLVRLNNSHDVVSSSTKRTSEYKKESGVVLEIGEITLTVCVVELGRHVLMIFEDDKQKSVLEYIVAKEDKGYDTSIFLNGRLLHQRTFDNNILEPVSIADSDGVKQTASEEGSSRLSPKYTYKWWDGVKQVTGPDWQIKYHHPARDYYQIAPWNDWSKEGWNIIHIQVNHDQSDFLATAGWAAIFAAAAAAVTGGYGAIGAAFLGSLLSDYFGALTGLLLKDEEGCIWFWWSIEFVEWFNANAWWLVTNPLGWGATIGALFAIGYLRISSRTLVDAYGFGSP